MCNQKYRERAGLTRAELSEKTGISQPTIFRWEKGTSHPRASDILKLCETLQVSEAELLGTGEEQNGKLKINIIWEVEDMDLLNMKKDEFNIGFQGDRVLLWGAIPADKDPDEAANEVRVELKLAQKMRALMISERGLAAAV